MAGSGLRWAAHQARESQAAQSKHVVLEKVTPSFQLQVFEDGMHERSMGGGFGGACGRVSQLDRCGASLAFHEQFIEIQNDIAYGGKSSHQNGVGCIR